MYSATIAITNSKINAVNYNRPNLYTHAHEYKGENNVIKMNNKIKHHAYDKFIFLFVYIIINLYYVCFWIVQ